MKKLDKEIIEEIDELAEEINATFLTEEYDKTIELCTEALNLLPEPASDWEDSVWFLASAGDAYFLKGDYQNTLDTFNKLLVENEEMENPFFWLRKGQAAYKLGDMETATDALGKAYSMEGKEMFAEEEAEYFDFIKTKINQ